jgi:hypothetical protein
MWAQLTVCLRPLIYRQLYLLQMWSDVIVTQKTGETGTQEIINDDLKALILLLLGLLYWDDTSCFSD